MKDWWANNRAMIVLSGLAFMLGIGTAVINYVDERFSAYIEAERDAAYQQGYNAATTAAATKAGFPPMNPSDMYQTVERPWRPTQLEQGR